MVIKKVLFSERVRYMIQNSPSISRENHRKTAYEKP